MPFTGGEARNRPERLDFHAEVWFWELESAALRRQGKPMIRHIVYFSVRSASDRQRVLEELHPDKRLRIVNDILTHEVDVISLESEMEQKVRRRVPYQYYFLLHRKRGLLRGSKLS